MIALIFAGDIKYCPYIKRYCERLNLLGEKYEVLFWNRSGFQINLPDNYIFFDYHSSLTKGKIAKVLDFYLFQKWVSKKIRENRYSKLILLSTLTGMFLFHELKKFDKKYILDIRDYSYENNKLYYFLEKKIIRNSFFTCISSKGFKEFLPNADYVIAHNFNRNDIRNVKQFKKRKKPLKLVWNGVMRYFEYQKQYIDILKNDERFIMVYHGDGPELSDYQEYCKKNNISNVIFTGSYNNSMKEELLYDADILNNCYGYKDYTSNEVKYAVSNRFYDGILYHIPQLVEREGFKAKWTIETKVGINLDINSDLGDNLYDYYYSLDEEAFNKACEEIKNKVIEEDNIYIKKIDEFLLS